MLGAVIIDRERARCSAPNAFAPFSTLNLFRFICTKAENRQQKKQNQTAF